MQNIGHFILVPVVFAAIFICRSWPRKLIYFLISWFKIGHAASWLWCTLIALANTSFLLRAFINKQYKNNIILKSSGGYLLKKKTQKTFASLKHKLITWLCLPLHFTLSGCRSQWFTLQPSLRNTETAAQAQRSTTEMCSEYRFRSLIELWQLHVKNVNKFKNKHDDILLYEKYTIQTWQALLDTNNPETGCMANTQTKFYWIFSRNERTSSGL